MASESEIHEFIKFIRGDIPVGCYYAYIDGLKNWGRRPEQYYAHSSAGSLISAAFDWDSTPCGDRSWEYLNGRWREKLDRLKGRYRNVYLPDKVKPIGGKCKSIW